MYEYTFEIPDNTGRDVEFTVETDYDAEKWEREYRSMYQYIRGMTAPAMIHMVTDYCNTMGWKVVHAARAA
jgi:hypothetical protein